MIACIFDSSQQLACNGHDMTDQDMTDQDVADIAIVGLGPVGSTAALLMAEAGLSVVTVERDREVYKLPRAVNLDGEIIRAFQRIGRGEAVDALLQKKREGERAGFANSKREFMFGQDMVEFGSSGWQVLNFFDQPELEQYIRDNATGHERTQNYIGFELTGFTDHGDSVTLNIKDCDTGATRSIKARYLVACDGASSFVRKSLDIGWKDLGYNHDWLVVDVITKEGHTLNNETLQVCSPERISTYVCTKDPYRRWEFKLNPGETWDEMLEEETIMGLIDEWTPRGTYTIRRAAVYQFHAATADQWRVNNVFIAGDAAHQTPPFLGQGMNAGMRDVINLAWKLPLVINGEADDSLLDTYESEREAHAHDLVDWAVSIGRLMEHLAAVELAERKGETQPSAPAALQSSGYGQGREQPPIRAGAVILPQVSDSGSTGYLFSQPIVREADGTTARFDEKLGPGFALVHKGTPPALKETSKDILSAIGANIVSVDGVEEERGHIDRLFAHADAAIVRPDRLVFGHTTDDISVDELIAELGVKLALTNL